MVAEKSSHNCAAGPLVVLLVDDDPDSRMLLRDAVESTSGSAVAIYEVANGQEALDFLYGRGAHMAAARPRLVFLDIEMPVLDGQETLQQIRSDSAFNDIAVVMMTGLSDECQVARAAANGANSYAVKPADARQLPRVVLASTGWLLAPAGSRQTENRAREN